MLVSHNITLEERLCIDEQIIPFKGKLDTKQYAKGKPKPWGFKGISCAKLLASCKIFSFIKVLLHCAHWHTLPGHRTVEPPHSAPARSGASTLYLCPWCMDRIQQARRHVSTSRAATAWPQLDGCLLFTKWPTPLGLSHHASDDKPKGVALPCASHRSGTCNQGFTAHGDPCHVLWAGCYRCCSVCWAHLGIHATAPPNPPNWHSQLTFDLCARRTLNSPSWSGLS